MQLATPLCRAELAHAIADALFVDEHDRDDRDSSVTSFKRRRRVEASETRSIENDDDDDNDDDEFEADADEWRAREQRRAALEAHADWSTSSALLGDDSGDADGDSSTSTTTTTATAAAAAFAALCGGSSSSIGVNGALRVALDAMHRRLAARARGDELTVSAVLWLCVFVLFDAGLYCVNDSYKLLLFRCVGLLLLAW